MKNIIYVIVLLVCSITLSAKPVSELTASKVANTFSAANIQTKMQHNSNLGDANIYSEQPNMELVYKSLPAPNVVANDNKNEQANPLFYIYNIENSGFIIVAGDDNVYPILGFSDKGIFDENNISPEFAYWINGYEQQINYVVQNNIPATSEIQTQWSNYLLGKTTPNKLQAVVEPLVETQWNQTPYYNDLAPNLYPAGCVATALTQIMRYYKYPTIGQGSNTYSTQEFSDLHAKFDSIPYLWNSMPKSISEPNNAIATLTYHVGVAVKMNYGKNGSGAAGLYSNNTKNVMTKNFGYNQSMESKMRYNYSEANWIKLLKTELDAARPIYYEGSGTEGGHAFVCDGYNYNDYFHFNWGWGSKYDGYFIVSNLNPGVGGAGAGDGKFNDGQGILINFIPGAEVTPSPEIKLISPSNNTYDVNPDSVVFAWEAVAGATKYIVNVGTDPFFANGSYSLFTIATTSTKLKIPSYSKLYWQVIAYKQTTPMLWSEVRYLTTDGRYALPDEPILISPNNKAENMPIDAVTFTWNKSKGAVHYTLRYGTTNFYSESTWTEFNNLKDTFYTVTNLKSDQTYYWRVAAYNLENYSSIESTRYNFKTTTTGISDPTIANEFAIMPNPTNSNAVLNFYLLQNVNAEISICDMTGNIVFTSSNYFVSGNNSININANIFTVGSYICRLSINGKQIATTNFVVTK